ncbi:hypothetical protein Dimus_022769 [Dionaea muscipula]
MPEMKTHSLISLLQEHDKKIKAISGNKENVLLLDSKRSLAQRARRERERLERTGILQPAIDSTHPANNKLKRKIVEKQCLTYTSSVNCDSDDEMRRSNIISNDARVRPDQDVLPITDATNMTPLNR